MRIAHWSIWGPNRSGMYETTRDIVLAQRDNGIDCGFIDAQSGQALTDGAFQTEGYAYADTADVYAMHLAIPQPYLTDGTPTAIFLHGHPLYSMQTELYQLEHANDKPFTTVLNLMNRTEDTWFVSMWEQEQGAYWRALDNCRDRLRFVPRGIRFGDKWSPNGPKRALDGDPCIVIADSFRLFKDSLSVLFGALEYWRRNPRARVYLFAMPPQNSQPRIALDRWVASSELHRMLAGVSEVVDYLPEVFRRADVVLSTVTGESRVVLEAQACGCPVVAPWPDADATVYDHWDPASIADGIEAALDCGMTREQRADATRARYPIQRTVQGLTALYEEMLS